jgi:hypothetical protein
MIHDVHLAVIDVDEAAMSEPVVDVVGFAAHLLPLGVRKGSDAGTLLAVERAVIAHSGGAQVALGLRELNETNHCRKSSWSR